MLLYHYSLTCNNLQTRCDVRRSFICTFSVSSNPDKAVCNRNLYVACSMIIILLRYTVLNRIENEILIKRETHLTLYQCFLFLS